jgi:hypothetical protein
MRGSRDRQFVKTSGAIESGLDAPCRRRREQRRGRRKKRCATALAVVDFEASWQTMMSEGELRIAEYSRTKRKVVEAFAETNCVIGSFGAWLRCCRRFQPLLMARLAHE